MKRCMVILLALVVWPVIRSRTVVDPQVEFKQLVDGDKASIDRDVNAVLNQVRKEQVTFTAGFEAWKKLRERAFIKLEVGGNGDGMWEKWALDFYSLPFYREGDPRRPWVPRVPSPPRFPRG